MTMSLRVLNGITIVCIILHYLRTQTRFFSFSYFNNLFGNAEKNVP